MRFRAIAVSVTGLLLASGAFLLWAGNGLPYPDATAELLKAQEEKAALLELVMLVGMAPTLTGSFLLWRNRRRGEK